MRPLFLLFAAALPFLARAVPIGPSANAPAPAPGDSAPAGTLVRLNDFGSDDVAYFSIPTQQPVGGVVLVHDTWGLNDGVRAAVEKLAAAGYIAIAPDLFNGETTADPAHAADMAAALSRPSAVKTIGAAVRFLRESPRFRAPRIAVVGWGMGSGLAVEAALKETGGRGLAGVAVIGIPSGVDFNKAAKLDTSLLALLDADSPAANAAFRQDFTDALRDRKDAEIADVEGATSAKRLASTWKLLLDFLDRSFHAPPRTTMSGVINSLDNINPFKPSDPKPAPAPLKTATPNP